MCLLAAPAGAATRVSLYPLERAGVSEEGARNTEDLVIAAMARLPDRLVAAGPKPVHDDCGPAKTAPLACLAALAGDGVVLRGKVSSELGKTRLVLVAIDRAMHIYGPVGIGIDLANFNLDPAVRLLNALADRFQPSQPEAQPPLSMQPQPPPEEPRRVPAQVFQAQPDAPSRLAVAGKWTAASGAALLLAGGVVGFLDKRLNDDLTGKYNSQTLSASDSSSYSRVHTYNVVATTLLIGGGIALGTGLILWASAPDEDEVRSDRMGLLR